MAVLQADPRRCGGAQPHHGREPRVPGHHAERQGGDVLRRDGEQPAGWRAGTRRSPAASGTRLPLRRGRATRAGSGRGPWASSRRRSIRGRPSASSRGRRTAATSPWWGRRRDGTRSPRDPGLHLCESPLPCRGAVCRHRPELDPERRLRSADRACPVPYKGVQYVSIPEFQSLGKTVSQQLAAYISGQKTLEQALADSQAAALKVAREGGYLR